MARSGSADKRRKPTADLMLFLNETQSGNSPGTKWSWWLYPKPQNHYFPYARDWAGTKDFWISVEDGSFADQVVAFAESIHDLLKIKRLRTRLR